MAIELYRELGITRLWSRGLTDILLRWLELKNTAALTV